MARALLASRHRTFGRQPLDKDEAAARQKRVGGSTMAKTNPAEFLQQVRNEGAKVTWPTRKETTVTTIMVLIMVIVASLFFLVADYVMGSLVRLLLGLGT